jgi:hypothetical protein
MADMSNYRFCKDCLHFLANTKECDATPNVDLVTGDMNPMPCWAMRAGLGECGTEGKLFVPNKAPLLELLQRSLEMGG